MRDRAGTSPLGAARSIALRTAMEEMAAYLATATDRTAASELLGTTWRSVGDMIARVVARKLDPDHLDGLRFIGVDEFSYRKRHHYVTAVVDHERGRVVWAGAGRSAETLGALFEALRPERIALLQAVTIDMSGGYIKAVQQHAPEAVVIFDRFHVQRLASDAVDQVRRRWMRELEGDEKRALEHTRFALLENPWNLTARQRRKLSEVRRLCRPLYRAYPLEEALAEVLSSLRPEHAAARLDEWLAWASRSRLRPFVRLARTIRRRKPGIVAFSFLRLTNGLVQGVNNRLRVIARRAYGSYSAPALIGMLFLACGGIDPEPTLP